MEDKKMGGPSEPVPTDYMKEFSLSPDQFSKIQDKFKRDKDFQPPASDAEKMYALD